MTNRIGVSIETGNLLGSYLRDRRTRLDPAALGFAAGRRRTPGLRREEVRKIQNGRCALGVFCIIREAQAVGR